jgi:hypothetical protein
MKAYPLSYYDPSQVYIGEEGHDLLQANGWMIRPQIGGKRKTKKTKTKIKTKTKTKTKGGFIPSIMGGFTSTAAKYITPMVLFAGYKMLKNPTKMKKIRTKKGKR